MIKKPNHETEQKLREDIAKEGGLEKNDLPAMILSAYLVIVPIAFLFLLLMFLIGWLLFH